MKLSMKMAFGQPNMLSDELLVGGLFDYCLITRVSFNSTITLGTLFKFKFSFLLWARSNLCHNGDGDRMLARSIKLDFLIHIVMKMIF
jgi:hypothetical protein